MLTILPARMVSYASQKLFSRRYFEELIIVKQRPLVGVYSSGKALFKLFNLSPGEKASALAKAANDLQQSVFFFSLLDVDTKKEEIMGTYWDAEADIWKQAIFPYPLVFYKRSGKNANSKKYNLFMEQLAAKGTHFLNHPISFNKCKVYEALAAKAAVKNYLPDTVLLRDKKILTAMLNKHSEVYVKACLGSRGRRVARVTVLGRDRYYWSHFRDLSTSKIVRGSANLYHEIYRFVLGRDCLIQEAIDLIRYNNRLIDFRAEVQRTGQGKIITYAIPIRIGAPKSPITTHSESYPFEQFLTNSLGFNGDQITDLRQRITIFLTDIYTALEDTYGPLGEVGIDFGLDKNGKLWFIECNSQSAKVSLFNSYNQEVIGQHFKTLIGYATSLVSELEEEIIN